MSYKKKTKKTRRQIDSAVVHVKATFNNTLVSVTVDGDVILRKSSGELGFKGPRKGTPFAASQVGSALAKEMIPMGIRVVQCKFQGPGSGRESISRALQASGINVTELQDVTPLPHNGCRAPKKRRV